MCLKSLLWLAIMSDDVRRLCHACHPVMTTKPMQLTLSWSRIDTSRDRASLLTTEATARGSFGPSDAPEPSSVEEPSEPSVSAVDTC